MSNQTRNTDSGAKIQGEGDYEAARRFDKAEHDFVNKGPQRKTHLNKAEEAEGNSAEAKGKARAKDRGHDKKDAELMRGKEKRGH